VKSSPTTIILFIYEAHTMIGAGGSECRAMPPTLLNPLGAEVELRTVARHHVVRVQEYFEKDPPSAPPLPTREWSKSPARQCELMLRVTAHPRPRKSPHVRILGRMALAASRQTFDRYLPLSPVSRIRPSRVATPPNLSPPGPCPEHIFCRRPSRMPTRTLDDIAVQTRVRDRGSGPRRQPQRTPGGTGRAKDGHREHRAACRRVT